MAQKNWWEDDEVVGAPLPPTLPEQKMGADIEQSGASTQKTQEEAITERTMRPYAVRKAAAEADAAEKTTGVPKLTAGQEQLDKAFGEDYLQWAVRGGRGDFQKARTQLKDALANLDESDMISGPVIGTLPEWLRAVVAPQSIQYPEEVQEIAQRNLRAILGGQFAMKEGEQLIARAFNPKLEEGVNKVRVQRLLKSLVSAADAKEDAARYFEEHGTLSGWKGSLPTMDSIDVVDDDKADDAPPLAAAGLDAQPGGGGTQNAPGGAPGPAGGPPTFSPGDPMYQATTGGRARETDPKLSAQMDAMLRQGADYDELNAYAMRNGAEPIDRRQYMEVRRFLQKNPDYEGSLVEATRYKPLSSYEQAVTRIGSNPIGAYTLGAGQFLTGNTLDNLAPDPARARLAAQISAAQNPTATAIGEISGAMLGSAAGEAALGRLGQLPRFLKGALADTSVGAANGAGMADDGNRALGALGGGASALTGTVLGTGVGAGASKLVRGVSDPSVQAVNAAQIPMTVGQTYGQSGFLGRTLKGAEDRLAGLPIIGDAINARRREGVEAFNTEAFERALKPVGGTVKGRTAEEAVAEAQDQISQAYTRALSGKTASIDTPFVRDLSRSVQKVASLKRVGPEVAQDVQDVFEPYKNNAMFTGDEMQAISLDLQRIKQSYKGDTRAHAIGKALDDIEDSVFGMFRRQAPEVVPDYTKVKAAYKRLSILEDAVLKAKNTEGVFTPAQLGTADRANTVKYGGKRAAARGEGPFHDYQRAAQTVLPSKVPDSGTAGRLLVPGALIGASSALGAAGGAASNSPGGAGAGAVDGATTGLTLAAILAGAFSKPGQRLLTKPGRGTSGAVGNLLQDERLRRALEMAGAGTGLSLLSDKYQQ